MHSNSLSCPKIFPLSSPALYWLPHLTCISSLKAKNVDLHTAKNIQIQLKVCFDICRPIFINWPPTYLLWSDLCARLHRRRRQIVGRLSSEGDTALLPSHFGSIPWCLFGFNVCRTPPSVHASWRWPCWMSRGARLGELPFQRTAHWHHVPPSRPVCGASYVEDLMDTALNTERGRITETEVTTKVGHEGSQKLRFFCRCFFLL